MKKLLGWAFLLLILVSASAPVSSKPDSMHTLQGTWELQNFYNYDGQNVTDTIPTAEGYRQIKMYYNGKVMWTRYVPKDSVEWFGYGSYRITTDRLIETLEYASASMMQNVSPPMVFEFELQLEDDTYSQITIDEDGNRTFSENYKRLD
jgi:hypothetical protein